MYLLRRSDLTPGLGEKVKKAQDDQYAVSGTADNLISLGEKVTCQVESQNSTFYSVKPSGECGSKNLGVGGLEGY